MSRSPCSSTPLTCSQRGTELPANSKPPKKTLEGWGFRGVSGVKSHNHHATSSGTHSCFEQANLLTAAWPH